MKYILLAVTVAAYSLNFVTFLNSAASTDSATFSKDTRRLKHQITIDDIRERRTNWDTTNQKNKAAYLEQTHAHRRSNVSPEMLRQRMQNIHLTDGNTPLHIAVTTMDTDAVPTLLDMTPNDVNTRNNDDLTPFYLAVTREPWQHATKNRQSLISSLLPFADVNMKYNCEENTLLHTLMIIATHSQFYKLNDTVNALLNKQADVNARNRHGDTPLHVLLKELASPFSYLSKPTASAHEEEFLYIQSLIEILIAHGASTTLPNIAGETPLILAQQYEFHELLPLLSKMI